MDEQKVCTDCQKVCCDTACATTEDGKCECSCESHASSKEGGSDKAIEEPAE